MINYITLAYIFVHTILIAANKKLNIVRRLSKLFLTKHYYYLIT